MADNNPVKSKIEQGLLDRIADAALSFWHRLQAIWFRWADLNQHSPWFHPVLALVIMIDAIIVLLPGDVILILATLSNPKAWKRNWFAGSVGGVAGGFLLYLLVSEFGADWAQDLNQALGLEEAWRFSRELFAEYGLVTIAIGSVIPGASWAPVVMAGLSSGEWHWVLVYLILGRTARYFVYCFGTREGWAIMHTIREKAKAEKQKALAQAVGKGPKKDDPDSGPSSSIQ